MKYLALTLIFIASCTSHKDNLYEQLSKKPVIYLVDLFVTLEIGIEPSVSYVLGDKPGAGMEYGGWIITFSEKKIILKEYDNEENEFPLTVKQLEALLKKVKISNKDKADALDKVDIILRDIKMKP